MLRTTLLLLGLALTAVSQAADVTHKVAYSRDGGLYVANLDGTSPKKVATGAWPDLSPDGTQLAFNTEDPGGKNSDRHIAIADVATGKIRKVPNIPSKNCYGPLWSPDNKHLVFRILAEEDWKIAIITTAGEDFRFVKHAGPKDNSYYSPAWAPDGKSLYCQDLDNIYRVGLDGEVQKKWAIAKLFPKGGTSSGARLTVSPDGNTLLMDVEMDEDVTRQDWEGPPPAIWSLKIGDGEVTRLTPKGLFAWQPCWLSNDAFLCVLQPASASKPSIYRMSADGKMRQALIKNANDVSVSR